MSLHWLNRSLAVVLLAFSASACFAMQTVLLDNFEDSSQWNFSNGGEYPGAKGSIACNSDGRLSLNYDFTNGGQYVETIYSGSTPPEMQEFHVNIWPTNDCRICYRIVDANGRTFEAESQHFEAGSKNAVTIPLSGHWINAWGGTPTPQPVLPVKQLSIMACRYDACPKAGTLFLSNLEGVSTSAVKLYSSQERRATPLAPDKTSPLLKKAKSLYYPEAKVGDITATVGYNGSDERFNDVRDLRVYDKDKLLLAFWGRVGLSGKTEYYNPMNTKVQAAKINGRDVWQWGNTDSRTGFTHICRTSFDAKGITSTIYFRFLKAHDGKLVLPFCPPEGTVKYLGATGGAGAEYGLVFPSTKATKAEYVLGDRKLSCLFSVAKPTGVTLHDGEMTWSHILCSFSKFSYIEIAPPNGTEFPSGYENAVQLRFTWDSSAKHPASIEACTWDDGVDLTLMEKDCGKWILPQTPQPMYFFAGDKKEIGVMLHNLSGRVSRSVELSCVVRDYRDRDVFTKKLKVSLSPSEMRRVVIPATVSEKGIYTVILSVGDREKISRFAVLPKPATVAAKDSFFGVDPMLFPGTDRDLDMLRAFGMRVLRLGGGVWYPGDVEVQKEYLRRVVRHGLGYFLLIGGKADFKADYKELGTSWEIVNEPNEPGNGWEPDTYAEEVRVTSEMIKTVNPNATVLGCDVTGLDLDGDFPFTRKFLAAGGGKYIDVIPFHPYMRIRLFGEGLNPMSPEDYKMLPKMLRAQEVTRANNLRLWIGEIGYMHRAILGFPGAKVDANEQGMANYLVRLYLLARCVPDMERVVWFQLSKDATTEALHPDEIMSYSLLGAENNVTPEMVAYANLASLTDGAKFERKLSFPVENLYGVLQSRGGKKILALWSAHDTYHLTFPSAKAIKITSIVGEGSQVKPVNGKITLTFTAEPFYIVSDDAALIDRIERAEVTTKEPVEINDIAAIGKNVSVVLRNKTAKPLPAKVECGNDVWSMKLEASERKSFTFPVKHAGQVTAVTVEANGSHTTKTVSKTAVKHDMVATRAEKPLTIDGDLSDWQNVSPVVLNKLDLVSPSDPGCWKGPEDLSATGYVKYDSQHLYFACAVKDDVQMNDELAGSIWAKDSIQLRVGNIWCPDAYTEISFGLSSKEGPVQFMNMGANQGMPVVGMKLSIKRNAGETVYEAAIPLAALKGVFVYPGCNLRFAFIVNDVDTVTLKRIAAKDPSLIRGTKNYPVLFLKP